MRSLLKVTAAGSRGYQYQREENVACDEFQFHKMKASWKEKWPWLSSMEMYLTQAVVSSTRGRGVGMLVSISEDESLLEREVGCLGNM